MYCILLVEKHLCYKIGNMACIKIFIVKFTILIISLNMRIIYVSLYGGYLYFICGA